MPKTIVIVPYDPEWPRIYEDEKRLIQSRVGDIIRSIEHVGSTSVPGLWAKPIIDIIAGIDYAEDADKCRDLLRQDGYDDVSPGIFEDWYYCLGKGPHSPGFHLHLVREGSPHHLKHLIFRDWLRAHNEDANSYKELKIELSERYRDERIAYTASKTDFINRIVEKAKKTKIERPS